MRDPTRDDPALSEHQPCMKSSQPPTSWHRPATLSHSYLFLGGDALSPQSAPFAESEKMCVKQGAWEAFPSHSLPWVKAWQSGSVCTRPPWLG